MFRLLAVISPCVLALCFAAPAGAALPELTPESGWKPRLSPYASTSGLFARPDGGVVIVQAVHNDANTPEDDRLVLRQFTDAGRPDPRFSGDGTTEFGARSWIMAEDEGALLVAQAVYMRGGQRWPALIDLHRIRADGEPDAAWGTRGYAEVSTLPPGTTARGELCGGWMTPRGAALLVQSGREFVIHHLTSGGVPDLTVGDAGWVRLEVPPSIDMHPSTCAQVTKLAGERVLLTRRQGYDVEERLSFVVDQTTGRVDAAWGGGDGLLELGSTTSSTGGQMVFPQEQLADGRILASVVDTTIVETPTQGATEVATSSWVGVRMLRPDGSADTRFGDRGTVVVDRSPTGWTSVTSVDVRAGRIIVASSQERGRYLGRVTQLRMDGRPDDAYGMRGQLTFELEHSARTVLDARGRLVTVSASSSSAAAVARFRTDAADVALRTASNFRRGGHLEVGIEVRSAGALTARAVVVVVDLPASARGVRGSFAGGRCVTRNIAAGMRVTCRRAALGAGVRARLRISGSAPARAVLRARASTTTRDANRANDLVRVGAR